MSPEVLSTSCDQLIHFLHSVREAAAGTAWLVRPGQTVVRVKPGAVSGVPGGEYRVVRNYTADGFGPALTLEEIVRHATKPPTAGRVFPRVLLYRVDVVPDFAAVAAHFGGGDLGAFLAGWCARGFDPFTGLLFADFLDEYGPDYAGVLGRFISPPGTLDGFVAQLRVLARFHDADGVPGRKPLNVFGPIRESVVSRQLNINPAALLRFRDPRPVEPVVLLPGAFLHTNPA